MKKLIMLNGTMGVGKSTVCSLLLKKLQPAVYLDGDWCWNMWPFVVSEENKEMALNNIAYLLRSFLDNSGYETVIFCWVIHQEEIFHQILTRLQGKEFELHQFTLICTRQTLRERLEKDVQHGLRQEEVIGRSMARLPLYEKMNTIKIWVDNCTPEEAAEKIQALIGSGIEREKDGA